MAQPRLAPIPPERPRDSITGPRGIAPMSLMKPRIMTPARIAASRRNAQKSTGPRTERGKIQSSMNGLKRGSRSPTYQRLFQAFLESMGESMEEIAQRLLTAEQRRHPVFAQYVQSLREVEAEMARAFPRPYRRRKPAQEPAEAESGRSGELVENTGPIETILVGKLTTY